LTRCGFPIPSEKPSFSYRSPGRRPGDLQGVQGGGQVLIVEDFQEIERLEQLQFRVDHGGLWWWTNGHFANKNNGHFAENHWDLVGVLATGK